MHAEHGLAACQVCCCCWHSAASIRHLSDKVKLLPPRSLLRHGIGHLSALAIIMDALRKLVQPCASGAQLLEALRAASLSEGSDIPRLIAAVINERLSAAGPSTPPGDAATGRVSVESALCVIDGLMFLNPRSVRPSRDLLGTCGRRRRHRQTLCCKTGASISWRCCRTGAW